jgi:hypothetical protein
MYRAAAHNSAMRNHVFRTGADGFMRWWRKLLAAVFPPARRKYDHIIGWWYKRWLKHEAQRIAEYDRDPERKAFAATTRKIRKEYAKKRKEAANV